MQNIVIYAKTDTPDVMFDFIEVTLPDGRECNIQWEESMYSYDSGFLRASLHGVELNVEGIRPTISRLREATIDTFALYYPSINFEAQDKNSLDLLSDEQREKISPVIVYKVFLFTASGGTLLSRDKLAQYYGMSCDELTHIENTSKAKDFTFENCPHCENEVVIFSTGVTACPECGAPLTPCSQCDACSSEVCPYLDFENPDAILKVTNRPITKEEINSCMQLKNERGIK